MIADQKESALQQMNSQMRCIDLVCKLASPVVVPLLDGLPTEVAILVTFGMNNTSMVVEYALIARVYEASVFWSRTDSEKDNSDSVEKIMS